MLQPASLGKCTKPAGAREKVAVIGLSIEVVRFQ